MRVAGVIVEFNPFHDGHHVHLRETRDLMRQENISSDSYIIALMSGNFVQRGEPAICDKWLRTKMALLAGVDIVIELPVPYVISGVDYFARGSVRLLAATGVVDAISFGSECGELGAIIEAGRVLAGEPPLYKKGLRSGLDRGLSFAAARGEALAGCLSRVPEGLLTKPNNCLAMEYCKALCLLGDPMKIFTTHRQKGGPSATKIRKAFRGGEPVEGLMPDFAYEILLNAREKGIACLDDYSDIFKYILYRQGSGGALSEGLTNRFRRFAGEYSRISDLLAAVKTKRYTYTRLQRAVVGMVLGVSVEDMEYYELHGGPQYIRVLGFRRESAGLVGEITKKAALPVITHGAAIDDILNWSGAAAKMLAKELEAGDIYRLATGAGGGFRSERGVGVVVV